MIRFESNVKNMFQKPVEPIEFIKKVHEILGTTPIKSFDEWQG